MSGLIRGIIHAMFCHVCGAKNLEQSRFCNQCGVAFATISLPPGSVSRPVSPSALITQPQPTIGTPAPSLDSTQLGVAGAAEMVRAAVEAERAALASGNGEAGPAVPSTRTPVVAPNVLPAVAAAAAAAPIGSPASAAATIPVGAAPSAYPPANPPAVASSFPLGAPSAIPSARSPVLSVTSSQPSLQKPGLDPRLLGDPSVSLHLAALGIHSAKKTWTVLIGGGLALLAAGILGTYFAMRTETSPQGTAHAGDPFTIGTPTADVDFVTGSADPRQPVMPNTADGGLAPTPPTTGTTGTPRQGRTGSLPLPDFRIPTTGTTGTASTTGATTGTTGTPDTTGTTGTPDTTGTTGTTGSTSPDPSNPEMDMEMYSARVRYLVRRYYAGRAQSCFDDATGRSPSLSGQVVLSIHIGADGAVSNARVARNTTGDDALGSCLASQANAWQLAPPPAGETDMQFPFSR